MRLTLLAGTALLAATVTAVAQTRIPEPALAQAAQLRERALADDTGWKVTESLTTEIGPRLPGSEADARAVPGPRPSSMNWALTGCGPSR